MDIIKVELSKKLGDLISNQFGIDWMKVSMISSEQEFEHFPALYLRFNKNDDKDAMSLNAMLSDFKGKFKWALEKYPLSRKDLYSITIEEFHNYNRHLAEDKNIYTSPSVFFGMEKYKMLCDEMMNDIEPLCAWIEECLLRFKE